MATLRDELESLRLRLKWYLKVRALLQTVLLISILVLGLGWLDYYFRPTHSIVRFLLSMLFWIGAASVVVLRLLPALFQKIQPLDVALALEKLEGTRSGELAAAVDFQASGDLDHSSSWKKELVQNYLESQVSPSTKVRSRNLIVQSILLGFGLLFLSLYAMPTVVTAVTRVVWPASQAEWPRLTKLRVYDQQRNPVAPGATISLMGSTGSNFYVEDMIGEPPEDVILEIRRTSQPLKRIRLQNRQPQNSSESGRETFRFRLVPNQMETMQFRIVGGDDQSMDWMTLRKEIKPVVQSMICQIDPPEYLNAESTILENVSGPVPAPVGALLQFDLSMNRPVRELELRDLESNAVVSQVVNGSHLRFDLDVAEAEEGSLIYELFVRVGPDLEVENSTGPGWQRVKRIRIEPLADLPPEVTVLAPQKDLRVTRDALVPYEATARDDYGLQDFSLKVEAKTPLSLAAEIQDGQLEATLTGTLDLRLLSVEEGDLIELSAVASDRSPEGVPVATSPIRMTVVSTQEKEQDLQALLEQASNELLAVYQTQQDILTETRQLTKESRDGEFTLEANEKLHLLQVRQQGVQETLRLRIQQGTLSAIASEIRVNQLDSQRVEELSSETTNAVGDLLDKEVSETMRSFQSLRTIGELARETETSEPARRRLLDELTRSMKLQGSVTTKLERILQTLDRWGSSADIRIQWKLIKSELRTVIEDLSAVDQLTISRAVSELDTEQVEQLRGFSKQHVALTVKLQGLRQQLEQSDSENWNEFKRELEEVQGEVQLQRAAEAVLGNKILRAIDIDRQLLQSFKNILLQDTLRQNQMEADLETYRAFEDELKTLAEQQSELHARWIRSEANEAIIQQQKKLTKKLQEMAERAEDIGLPQIDELLTDSISEVDSLLGAVADGESILQRTELEAIDENLEAAMNVVGERVRTLQDRDQSQLIRQLTLLAKELVEEQKSVIQEFAFIKEAVAANRRLTRSQRRQLLELAQVEQEIANKLTPFQESTGNLPVLNESLKSLIELLEVVAGRFKKNDELPEVENDLATIQLRLAQLSGLSSDLTETSPGEANAGLPPEVRVQLTLLLQKQKELAEQEKILIDRGEIITEEMQSRFLARQREISKRLEEIFESIEKLTQ
ncbi:CCDC158 family protein [Thalassoglobus polymorphus]|uniref:Uncharacterized protein n=1 Tax=Thalassoglobus polymorphus TaxID=2527994 RepID=A0A517QRF1_9PLAN|nr:hypothetical protein [Thalassoglobus polymorphus]QDT34206.1 hypothetical protein Mal48_34660 [Thalassoglobus polymorphus]